MSPLQENKSVSINSPLLLRVSADLKESECLSQLHLK